MSKKFTAFENTTTTAATPAVEVMTGAEPSWRSYDDVAVQVEITGGTATVSVEARIGQSLSWVPVETGIQSNKIVRIGVCREVRLKPTVISGATVGGGVLH